LFETSFEFATGNENLILH